MEDGNVELSGPPVTVGVAALRGVAAAAAIAVAEARALTTEASLAAGTKLFELAGTQSTLDHLNLDRHWRNVRVHSLHDPARWKYVHLGNHTLRGIRPPRLGLVL